MNFWLRLIPSKLLDLSVGADDFLRLDFVGFAIFFFNLLAKFVDVVMFF